MTARASVVTETDVELLRSLAREGSVVAASRSVGISRDRATYRLARLRRAFGGPVVSANRGGRGHGSTRLTPLGDRIVRGGFGSIERLESQPFGPPSRSNHLEGTYRREPAPAVDVAGGLRLRVAFPAVDGEAVGLMLDPESILVARQRFRSSARNVLAGTIEAVRTGAGAAGTTLQVRTGGVSLRVAITEEPVRQMHLHAGARVWLYIKATALRRVGPAGAPPTRGSPRS